MAQAYIIVLQLIFSIFHVFQLVFFYFLVQFFLLVASKDVVLELTSRLRITYSCLMNKMQERIGM